MSQARLNFSSRIANEPELKYSQGGTAYLSLRFAHTAGYKNRQTDEWVETSTTWCQMMFWGDQAERVLSMGPRKGYIIVGGGNIDGIDTYQPQTGGELRTTLNIKAWVNDLAFMPPPASNNGQVVNHRPMMQPVQQQAPAPPIQEGAPVTLAAPVDDFEEGEDLPW